MKKSTLILLAALLLCACQPNPVIQIKEKPILVVPPDAMLIDCVLVVPTDPTTYLKADKDKREDYLSDLIGDQYAAVGTCNKNMQLLRDWKVKQTKQFQQENK